MPNFDGDLQELGLLAATAGLHPVARVTCKRRAPDAALFLGSGKADEIKLLAQQLGATEILFDQALSPAQAAKKAGAKVLLVGMQVPPNYGTAYADRFTGLFDQVARANQVALVPFLLKGVADVADPTELFQNDRIHPKAEAQPAMLANVWPELRKQLK